MQNCIQRTHEIVPARRRSSSPILLFIPIPDSRGTEKFKEGFLRRFSYFRQGRGRAAPLQFAIVEQHCKAAQEAAACFGL
jgi:hypothetical protein